MNITKTIRGYSLVELMVALVINAILFIALFGIFVGNLGHYSTSLGTNRLNRQLESAMQLMAMDISRAGYWSQASTNIGTNTNTNPFMSTASGTDIATGASNTCITFTYDHLGTGSLPSLSTTSDDDRYGFRLMNGAIQSRPWGATFSCTAPASSWEDITDKNLVNITALTFVLTVQAMPVGGGTSTLSLRSVDISITGQLVSNPSITNTLTQHVRVRNDKFNP